MALAVALLSLALVAATYHRAGTVRLIAPDADTVQVCLVRSVNGEVSLGCDPATPGAEQLLSASPGRYRATAKDAAGNESEPSEDVAVIYPSGCDLFQDARITATDSYRLIRCLLRLDTCSALSCDVTGNGQTTATDALRMNQCLVGMENYCP